MELTLVARNWSRTTYCIISFVSFAMRHRSNGDLEALDEELVLKYLFNCKMFSTQGWVNRWITLPILVVVAIRRHKDWVASACAHVANLYKMSITSPMGKTNHFTSTKTLWEFHLHGEYGILLILLRYLLDLLPYLAVWKSRRNLLTQLSILHL